MNSPHDQNHVPARLVVIGTSAGGYDALQELLALLPVDFNAAILIVKHLPPYASADTLVGRLQRSCRLHCEVAVDGAPITRGRVYLARADHHLLVDRNKIWVTRGARENRWRPAIDSLFRSAAVAHSTGVIGVILTGYLDDGVAGLTAVKRCGGLAIVQDPVDADHPELPLNALDRVEVDHCVPLQQIPPLLVRLVDIHPAAAAPVPPDIATEARISLTAASTIQDLSDWGLTAPITCPDCGGVLFENKGGGTLHLRCHTGHTFGPDSLNVAQTQKIEQTLWVALRLFQEKREVLAKLLKESCGPSWDSVRERIQETEGHALRIKEILGIL